MPVTDFRDRMMPKSFNVKTEHNKLCFCYEAFYLNLMLSIVVNQFARGDSVELSPDGDSSRLSSSSDKDGEPKYDT